MTGLVWWLCPACAVAQERGETDLIEPPALRPYIAHFLRTRGTLIPSGMALDTPLRWTCDCCEEPQPGYVLPCRFT